MATEHSTAAASPAVDRWGRPCPIAEAREYFDDMLEADPADRHIDRYSLVHGLARDLLVTDRRLNELSYALELAESNLPNSTDDDEVRALLKMAIEYHRDTCNRHFRIGAKVLVAVGTSDLEASHG